MRKLQTAVALLALVLVAGACGQKKKSEDIITQRVVKAAPKEPISMQEYVDERDIDWIGKKYHVAIHRHAADSLPMVKDESGQQFIDNVFNIAVTREDGSVFYSKKFTKAMVASYLDTDFRTTGIFEGLVFDRVDGDWIVFGASVGHPQTDEYIPLVIRLSRMGQLEIRRDTQLDTSTDSAPTTQDEDGV